LQGGYYFGVGKPYEGGVIPPEADYMEVGERLALEVRRDFTFLHPEVLEDRCSVAGRELRLNNRTNAEQYRVLVLPGSRTIHWSSLQKIKAFYDQGGTVIATTRLPDAAAEFGKDAAVREAVQAVFGTETPTLARPAAPYTVRANDRGGRAYFAASPSASTLKTVLDEALATADVRMETGATLTGGNLSYLHKAIGGRHVYFFANSSDDAVTAQVTLRGKLDLEWWDPHTGKITPAEVTRATVKDEPLTRVGLRLEPVHSLFLVEPGPANPNQ
jgi:hypothetical protein